MYILCLNNIILALIVSCYFLLMLLLLQSNYPQSFGSYQGYGGYGNFTVPQNMGYTSGPPPPPMGGYGGYGGYGGGAFRHSAYNNQCKYMHMIKYSSNDLKVDTCTKFAVIEYCIYFTFSLQFDAIFEFFTSWNFG